MLQSTVGFVDEQRQVFAAQQDPGNSSHTSDRYTYTMSIIFTCVLIGV